MEQTFRASMNWLHTWAGVVLGSVLFVIFWMGTLSVFDREIDRWMAPMTRVAVPTGPVSVDVLRPSLDQAGAAKATLWFVILPTGREPVLRVMFEDAGKFIERAMDPATGTPLPDPGTHAGTRFIYPFHYMLHIELWEIGIWIVGLAAMAMLALCVSGVIVHRKIFTDFFTYRADKQPRRLILDLHNVTGVLAFPFHVAISLSGLIIFYSVYFHSALDIAYPGGDHAAFGTEAFGMFERPALGKPGEVASLDAMVAEARRLWQGEEPRFLSVRHPGDAAAYVSIFRPVDNRVSINSDVAYFDAATGRLLEHSAGTRPVISAYSFISGLHMIQFRHWTLRWLYFGAGLVGCVMIATGFLFWLESRRKKHVQLGLRGVRIVEGLTIGSVTGIVIATLSFFVVNRLLPLGASFLGESRAALEMWAFYLVWLATFGHAWLRSARAWIEQCWGVAALAVAAVLLNWITTGDHLMRSLGHNHLSAVAGMDLLLLGGAAIAALTAYRLRRRAGAATRRHAPARVTGSPAASGRPGSPG